MFLKQNNGTKQLRGSHLFKMLSIVLESFETCSRCGKTAYLCAGMLSLFDLLQIHVPL